MSFRLGLLAAHTGRVSADERARLAERLREALESARAGSGNGHADGLRRLSGAVLLETCHRVELYADEALLAAVPGQALPAGGDRLSGRAAHLHLLRMAVGRDSAVIAEDQLLHQLRTAVQQARRTRQLPVELDRLFDLALRAGRRARSWLPARRPSLADVALERVLGGEQRSDGPVLVVGSGEMGERAARALARRGNRFVVASRTPERAAGLAGRLGARAVSWDPGPELVAELSGVVLALAGPWPLSRAGERALLGSASWVVDLSAPPSLPASLAERLGGRLLTIDGLARVSVGSPPSSVLLERLDRLVDETLDEYDSWSAHELQRNAARALARKADAAQAAELDALWQRMPQLADEQRAEVERMARHLTERLLRDPLERLQQDGDGRHASAARELFRL